MKILKKINISYIRLFLSLIFVDQLTKYFVFKNLLDKTITVFNGFDLCLVVNRGVSFSFFNFEQDVLFYLLSFVILSVIIIFSIITYWDARKGLPIFFNMLIISGACSNLIDRIVYNGVIDFLDFYYYSYHWPTFNLADIFIVIGVFGLLGRIFYYDYLRKD